LDNLVFLSEAGTVLIFFCFVFLYQDKKNEERVILYELNSA